MLYTFVNFFCVFFTGLEDLANVSPEHVSPVIRKLYWGESLKSNKIVPANSNGMENRQSETEATKM